MQETASKLTRNPSLISLPTPQVHEDSVASVKSTQLGDIAPKEKTKEENPSPTTTITKHHQQQQQPHPPPTSSSPQLSSQPAG
jgi:hypothetical protein